MNFAIVKPFLVAYTFGITSPTNKIMVVIKKTSIQKRNNSFVAEAPNTESSKKLEIITTPTFTKLLAIRMVANKSWGDFKSSLAVSACLPSSIFKTSFSKGPMEKYATSEAEIKAEQTSKIKIVKTLKITVPLKEVFVASVISKEIVCII